MTVRQMLHTIDSHELSEWIAYANLEPFGDEREDIRHGIQCAATVNSAFGSRGRSRPGDFIPQFGKRQSVSVEEVKNGFAAYAAAFKGK